MREADQPKKRKEIPIGSEVRVTQPQQHKGNSYSLDHLLVYLEIPEGIIGVVVDDGVTASQKVVRFSVSDEDGNTVILQCPVSCNGISPVR